MKKRETDTTVRTDGTQGTDRMEVCCCHPRPCLHSGGFWGFGGGDDAGSAKERVPEVSRVAFVNEIHAPLERLVRGLERRRSSSWR